MRQAQTYRAARRNAARARGTLTPPRPKLHRYEAYKPVIRWKQTGEAARRLRQQEGRANV